jgi:hypothetical protein
MTTINLRRTRGRDLWTLRETISEENRRGEDETPEALTPEEKYHHYIWMDMQQGSVDFKRENFG